MILIKFIYSLYFLLLLFSISNAVAWTEKLRFTDIINKESGLTNDNAKAILQDKQGFIWIGTQDGLNRFDGYQILNYKHNPYNKNSLSGNDITSLLEDKKGNIWIGTFSRGLNKFDPGTDSFINYDYQADNQQGTLHSHIYDLAEDNDGNIWIASGNGISQYNTQNNVFSHYKLQADTQEETTNHIAQTVFASSTGFVFAGTNNGLYIIHPKTNQINHYQTNRDKNNNIRIIDIKDILEDQDKHLWFLTSNGVAQWQPLSETFALFEYDQIKALSEHNGLAFTCDKNGVLWIATIQGLYQFNPKTKNTHYYFKNPYDPTSLNDLALDHLYVDNNNILWIATAFNGVIKTDLQTRQFDRLTHIEGIENSLKHKNIQSISEDTQGYIWVVTLEGTLHKIDKNNKIIEKYAEEIFVSQYKEIAAPGFVINAGNNELWIATVYDGLKKFNTITKEIQHFLHKPNNPYLTNRNEVWYFFQDSKKRLWLPLLKTLGIMDTADNNKMSYFSYTTERVEGLPFDTLINQIIEDKSGGIWLATRNGLAKYRENTNDFKMHRFNKNTQAESSSSSINTIYIDKENIFWLGTNNGFIMFNPRSLETHTYNKLDGLSNNTVVGIKQDDSGNLWISTNHGLNKFNPKTKKIVHFFKEHGIQYNEFDFNASLYSSDGRLFFGGPEGLTIFRADEVSLNNRKPSPVISDFRILGKKARELLPDFKKAIHLVDSITIPDNLNDLSFSLSALDYINPKRNRYAYKLGGFHKQWINVDALNRNISFTGLPANEYVLYYKASNNDGLWSDEKQLTIIITPPWWKTPWAYTFYIILLAVAVILLIYMRTGILAARALMLEQKILDRTNELAQKNATIESLLSEKDKIFANISHELRTPLTLILSPIQSIINEAKKSSIINNSVIIQKNAQRLLRLVNQLIDLSRLQYKSTMRQKSSSSRNVSKNAEQSTFINPLTESIINTFTNISKDKSINYKTQIQDNMWVFCNQDNYEKILINLLSNAFKYTLDDGKIDLSIFFSETDNFINIKIKDTGIGIPKEQQQQIFERFSRADVSSTMNITGAGIGLSLVKELVEEAEGNIKLQSDPDKGSSFTIQLPGFLAPCDQAAEKKITGSNKSDAYTNNLILETAYLTDNGIGQSLTSQNEFDNNLIDNKYQLLIIEDNADLCLYLKQIYQHQYQCTIAVNGKEGLEIARQEIPDIILCDIMMPLLNGYEVCRLLKNDDKTCHIPIVLLTALSDHEYKLQGLKEHADAYLAKPFDNDELSICLENLIILRERLKTYFKINHSSDLSDSESQEPFIKYSKIANSQDVKFIQKIEEILEAHYHDSTFTIDNMAEKINMSKRQVYRKTIAIIGESPGNMLRSYRMYKANILLKQGQSVIETAFDIGYSNASHFSAAYKSYFKSTPTEYQNKIFNKNANIKETS